MVQCDTCGPCVHRSCYSQIDATNALSASDNAEASVSHALGAFRCQLCATYGSAAPVVQQRCELCPRSGGAYILLEKKRNLWVHSYCMCWTPGAYFQDPYHFTGPVIKDASFPLQIKWLCKRGGAPKGRSQDMTLILVFKEFYSL